MEPPSTNMVWLGLEFDSYNMTVSIPQVKLQELLQLAEEWRNKTSASFHQLQLGPTRQAVPYSAVLPAMTARLFLNRMLATLRQCPETVEITLDMEFKKYLSWCQKYLARTNGVFIIDQDNRPPVHIYVDAHITGCGSLCQAKAYNSEFPPALLRESHPICVLKTINAKVALKCWTPNSEERRWLCIVIVLQW